MLKKIHSFFSKCYDLLSPLINLIYILTAATVSFELGYYFKIAYGISVFVALELLHILKIPQNVFKNFNLIAVLLPAGGMFYPIYKLFRLQQDLHSVIPFGAFKALFLANYLICVWVIAGIICAKYTKEGIWHAIKSLLAAGGVLFVLFVFLPTDSFIANAEEFELTYGMFVGNFLHAYAIYALPAVLLLICIQGKLFDTIADICFGVILAFYIQVQFLNNHLGLLGTSEATFAENIPLVVFNLILWIVLVSLPAVIRQILDGKLSKLANLLDFVPIALFLVSFTLTLITAPSYAYHITTDFYFDPSEQYTLSSDSNVVVFVLDAYDEHYLDKLFDEQPELFDDLHDFTVYTDAVSVYDSTSTSMSQMFGGCVFDNTLNIHEWLENGWCSDKTVSFYNSLHEAGYTVNGYNMCVPYPEYLEGKIDNLHMYDEPIELEPAEFEYDKLAESLRTLSMYRAFPYVVKQFIPIGDYDFKNFVEFEDVIDADYLNEDYEANLNLTVTGDAKYVSIVHLNGAHLPYDCYVESEHCIRILSEYCRQLKTLGIYDNTSIIVLSDHGEHLEGPACQPICLIKPAGASSSSLTMDASPVYFEDIMPTIAELAGINPIADSNNPYGTSIFSLNEDMSRERTWYDRVRNDSYPPVFNTGHLSYAGIYNTYYAYEFTGTYDDLYDMTINDNVSYIYPMTEYFG